MNRILQLQQDKTAAIDGAQAILAKMSTENRSKMSDEEKAQFDGFKASAKDIDHTIAAETEMAELRGNAFRDTPVATSVHDNAVDRPWGPESRGSESGEQRKKRLVLGFGEYLSAVKNGELARISGRAVDPRLLALNEGYEKRAAAAGSSESVPSDGGFLVYPDFSQEIMQLAHDTGLIYPRTRKLPLSEFTNAVKIPAIDETSRADGFRWGGVQMFWENEAQALIGSKPTFNLVELVTKKLTGLYYATNEVLADTRLLGSVVMQAFSEEMGYKLDDGVFRGTGAGQLSGFLKANATITVNKETGQAAATVVFENIKKMWGRMWPRSRKNCVWLVNQDVEQQLAGMLVSGTQVPAYLPPGSGVFGGAAGSPLVANDGTNSVHGTLYGRPVIVVEQCSTLGALGDIVLVDLSQYLMVDKGDMQTATSMHVRFLTDEQTFRWIYRCDGQPWWKAPLTPANGTNTLSPFILLQAR